MHTFSPCARVVFAHEIALANRHTSLSYTLAAIQMSLATSCRSLMGAGIFITAVVLGTVILVSKMPYKIGKSIC